MAQRLSNILKTPRNVIIRPGYVSPTFPSQHLAFPIYMKRFPFSRYVSMAFPDVSGRFPVPKRFRYGIGTLQAIPCIIGTHYKVCVPNLCEAIVVDGNVA